MFHRVLLIFPRHVLHTVREYNRMRIPIIITEKFLPKFTDLNVRNVACRARKVIWHPLASETGVTGKHFRHARVTGYAGTEIRDRLTRTMRMFCLPSRLPDLTNLQARWPGGNDREGPAISGKLFAVDSVPVRDGEHLLPPLSRFNQRPGSRRSNYERGSRTDVMPRDGRV